MAKTKETAAPEAQVQEQEGSLLDQILSEGRLARDDSQKERAKDKIGESFRVLAPQADFQAALRAPVGDAAANQAFISQMKAGSAAGDAASGFGNALNDSSFLNLIDPRLARPFLVGFSDAMSTVFLVASVLLVFAFIASLFLPHVELRSAASFQKARAGGPDDGDSAAPTGAATEQADDLAPPAIGH